MKKIITLMLLMTIGLLQGCSPKVGSDDWCKEIMGNPSKSADAMFDYPQEVQACSMKVIGKMMENM